MHFPDVVSYEVWIPFRVSRVSQLCYSVRILAFLVPLFSFLVNCRCLFWMLLTSLSLLNFRSTAILTPIILWSLPAWNLTFVTVLLLLLFNLCYVVIELFMYSIVWDVAEANTWTICIVHLCDSRIIRVATLSETHLLDSGFQFIVYQEHICFNCWYSLII